jgi:hypothetical protein
VLVSIQDISLSSSILQNWLGMHVPVAIEIAGLSLAWYASSALAYKRLWLLAAIGFAVVALAMPANPFWVLVGVTCVAALLAMGVGRFADRVWAAALYSVAMFSGIMAGYAGYVQGQWMAASWVLLALAAFAYMLALLEGVPPALWLVTAFATWSLIYAAVLLGDLYRPPIVALLCAGIGAAMACLRFFNNRHRQACHSERSEESRFTTKNSGTIRPRFFAALRMTCLPMVAVENHHKQRLLTYSLPIYATALAAALLTGVYGTLVGVNAPFFGAVPDAMFVYALVAFGILLLERASEALFIPIGLAAWAIALLPFGLIPHLLAFDLLCATVFATQFAWRAVALVPRQALAIRLHHVFSLAGQAIIILYIIAQGGLLTGAGNLAHVGAVSLLALAILLLWYGRLQSTVAMQRYCAYGAGLLLSIVVTWELLALGYTRLELLSLAPASYLAIAAPFLMRDERLPYHRSAGQVAAILGAALLLLPELWLAFGQDNLLPTLLLAGESLLLLILGTTTRVRIFVLSGAGLVVVSGLRALFLPTLGLPPSLALTVLGITLLAIATGLSLARHRLQVAWTRWE